MWINNRSRIWTKFKLKNLILSDIKQNLSKVTRIIVKGFKVEYWTNLETFKRQHGAILLTNNVSSETISLSVEQYRWV